MVELIILRGISGSGKSTYASKHFPNHICCEADQFFMKDGVYKFDRQWLGRAHTACQMMTRIHLKDGKSVVVSNTSTTAKEVNQYVKIAEEVGVPYRILRLTKQFQNVHNVPNEIVESMKRRMTDYPGEELILDY